MFTKRCKVVGVVYCILEHEFCCFSSVRVFIIHFVRYKVAYKKESGQCKLEISMTFSDDAGEYSVFAKNQLGEVSASASLLEEGT